MMCHQQEMPAVEEAFCNNLFVKGAMYQLLDTIKAARLAADVTKCVCTDTDLAPNTEIFLKLLHFCWNTYSGTAV